MALKKNLITLVIGGCRSGKSGHALHLAESTVAQNRKALRSAPGFINATELKQDAAPIKRDGKIFMATSVPADSEMEARVIKHKNERGEEWRTVEVPVELPASIREISGSAELILVDCLTLWVSNMMFNDFSDSRIEDMVEDLKSALRESEVPLFLVSNEVGMGIVPENGVARRFRDLAGMVNQRIAEAADRVIFMVAGIPLTIKE